MNGDREGNRLIEMARDAFHTQIATQPTRENNIPDLVFASDPDLLRDCKVGEKLSGCDHHLIRFNIKTEYKLTDNKTKIPDYRKANFNRARHLLPPVAWNRLNLSDADTAWTDFKNKLSEVERATVPMKTRRVNSTLNPPWMTANVKIAINRKKRNYNLMKQQATAEASEHYHRSLKACRTLIRKSKRNYEKKVASEAKANPKRFFTYIRTKKKAKNNVVPLTVENGVLTQGSKQMAGILNKNFASLLNTATVPTVPTSPTLTRDVEPQEIGTIQEQEVQKHLDKLDINKSTGSENLPQRLLKELQRQILQPLTSIFSRSV